MVTRRAPAARPTVLVVDDDPDLHSLLRQLLSEAGYRVRLASHGLEALVLLQQEAVAVLLLDLNMPGMSGWDCLAALRALQHPVPVVLMTAGHEVAAEAQHLGVAGYLAKPFDLAAVLQAVQPHAPC